MCYFHLRYWCCCRCCRVLIVIKSFNNYSIFASISNLNLPIRECAKLKGLQITCTSTVAEGKLRKITVAECRWGLSCFIDHQWDLLKLSKKLPFWLFLFFGVIHSYIYIYKVFRSKNTLFKIFRHVAFVSLSFLVYQNFILQFLIKTIFTIIIQP